ncbi:MAG: GNAT family N-acetyltransferase [Anaerolineae bacterium]|nr:GNAT family N-acetyltransferase [Anaerolineae bacterium]
MMLREYNRDQDRAAVQRIWREIGWTEDSDEHNKGVDLHLDSARVLVAEVNGAAECMAAAMSGQIRHLDSTLSLSAVTAVATSIIARKQSLAKRVTATLIAREAAAGAAVSALGMFEQGFYNRLGFGSFPYIHIVSFDPAQLNIKRRARVPRRLGSDDFAQMHAALAERMPVHGGVVLEPPGFIHAETYWIKGLLALGYADGPDGAISHWIIGGMQGENGPLTIEYMAYQTWEQFIELLALLKSMGDQVRLVRMFEPAGIQLQDLLIQPFRYQQLTDKSPFANRNRAIAFMQARINDLATCMSATHLPGGETLRFNLLLHDAVAKHLAADEPWQGISGEYAITLGPDSAAAPGSDPALPTLEASVGAFTRLWMGVRPASGLAVTDRLSGPPELLAALDRRLCLPQPYMDQQF